MSFVPSADEATDTQPASGAPVGVQTWADTGLMAVNRLQNAAKDKSWFFIFWSGLLRANAGRKGRLPQSLPAFPAKLRCFDPLVLNLSPRLH
jgi:hypothetical protein